MDRRTALTITISVPVAAAAGVGVAQARKAAQPVLNNGPAQPCPNPDSPTARPPSVPPPTSTPNPAPPSARPPTTTQPATPQTPPTQTPSTQTPSAAPGPTSAPPPTAPGQGWVTAISGGWVPSPEFDKFRQATDLKRMPIVYEQSYFGVGKPGGRKYRVDNDPTEPDPRWFADVRKSAAESPDDRGIVIADVEIYLQYPWVEVDSTGPGYQKRPKWSAASPTTTAGRVHPNGGSHRQNIKKLAQIALRTAEATNKPVSMYGFPVVSDFYGYLPDHPNNKNMKAANDAYLEPHQLSTLDGQLVEKSMLDVVTEFHPTVYVRVRDFASWKVSVTNQITDALRIANAYAKANNLPSRKHRIMPFIGPEYSFQVDAALPQNTPESKLLAYKPLGYARFTEVLQTIKSAGADGVVIWGGYNARNYTFTGNPGKPSRRQLPKFARQQWDSNIEWARALSDFLGKS